MRSRPSTGEQQLPQNPHEDPVPEPSAGPRLQLRIVGRRDQVLVRDAVQVDGRRAAAPTKPYMQTLFLNPQQGRACSCGS